MNTQNKKIIRETNKNLIEANLTIGLLLPCLAEAETVIPKALAALREEKFPWRDIFRTNRQILNNIEKAIGAYNDAEMLAKRIDSLESTLNKSIEKLNAAGYDLPALNAPRQAHELSAFKKLKLPEISSYKNAVEYRQNLIENAIEQDRKEIAQATLSAWRAAKPAPAVVPAKARKTSSRKAPRQGNKKGHSVEQGRG